MWREWRPLHAAMSAGLDFDDPLTLIKGRLQEHRAARKEADDDIAALERERLAILHAMKRAQFALEYADAKIKFRGLEGRAFDRALEEMQTAYEQIRATSAHMALIAETMEHDPSKLEEILAAQDADEADEAAADAPSPPRPPGPPPPAR